MPWTADIGPVAATSPRRRTPARPRAAQGSGMCRRARAAIPLAPCSSRPEPARSC